MYTFSTLERVVPVQIEDGVLAPFSASLGVSSYRQLQEELEATKKKRAEALETVSQRVAQLGQQVWRLTSRLLISACNYVFVGTLV